MVSLSRGVRQPGGGVTFFSDSINSFNDDDPLLDSMPAVPRQTENSCWMAEEMKKYRAIKTPKVIVITKFLYVCLGLAAFLIPQFCAADKCGKREVTSLVLYVHGGMWFLILLVHMYLYYEHRNSLLHGYFSFHLETRTLRKAPLIINSGANAILLVVSRVLDEVCLDNNCPVLKKEQYYQILIMVEVVIALVFLVIYFVKSVRFNFAKDLPDFLRAGGNTGAARSQTQVGFRSKSYERLMTRVMVLMWYEVYFWKSTRISLCQDVLYLNELLLQLTQNGQAQTPFNMRCWAVNQCWNEVYQLRQGCASLVQEKHNLKQRLKDLHHSGTVTIN